MPRMVKSSKPPHAFSRPTSSAPGNFPSAEVDEAENGLQLAGHFLIAMPSMLDPVFGGTVVYLCEHNAEGALGVIINKTTNLTMEALFERVDLQLEGEGDRPVLFGGPVQVERGFVLHTAQQEYTSTVKVGPHAYLTTSRDVLEAVAAARGPAQFLVTLGCAGWSGGQLEQEIASNGWLTVPADASIIFDVPIEQRFVAALNLLGIDPAMLTASAGHA